MASVTKVISFRLDERIEEEKEVLTILQDFQDKGYTHREVMVDAVLRASGLNPSHYHRDKLTLTAIEQVLDAQMEGLRSLVQELASTIAQQAANGTLPVNADSTAQEYDAYANNLLAGIEARKRRRK